MQLERVSVGMAALHTTALQALMVDKSFEGDVRAREPLARHTSYRIGGPARFFVLVETLTALNRVLSACREDGLPWVVLGKGSNVLVSDEGYEGVVLILGRGFKECRYDEERGRFAAGAGVSLSLVVQEAFRRELAGMEFAVGTPGTIGGALRMNAGTEDDWLGERVRSVTSLHPSYGMRRRPGDEIEWTYRFSSLPEDEVILECELAVASSQSTYIRGKMEAILARRRRTQPLDFPSCGSIFKNPSGYSAGALVEEAGLKGLRVGGAQISTLHANFIVNVGNALAADVQSLIGLAQNKVKETYGIELQTEVKFLGFA